MNYIYSIRILPYVYWAKCWIDFVFLHNNFASFYLFFIFPCKTDPKRKKISIWVQPVHTNTQRVGWSAVLGFVWSPLSKLPLGPVVQRLDNAFQRISVNKTKHAIRWIVIYPVDSVIQPLNNRGQEYILFESGLFFLIDTEYAKMTRSFRENHTSISSSVFPGPEPGGGGTPIYGLYRYVPRNRVWLFRFSVLK